MVRLHLEYANSVWCPYKRDIGVIEQVQKRATKLIISLKHILHMEILKQLKLPTLKYRHLCGDMIVFKIVYNYYGSKTVVKMNFNSFQITRRNKYKLRKFVKCHYKSRKYSFCSRLVNVWNTLPNNMVEADTINIFKNRLNKHCINQEVLFNLNADLTGSVSLPIGMRTWF